MAVYNRKICLSNLYFLSKEKGIRLGDIETTAGVSPGYFSRLNKEDSTANPSVEVLSSVADQLGVPIDGLISQDYSSMSESERFVMDFLDKLVIDSDAGDAIWERQTQSYLNNLDIDQDGNTAHPLFEAFWDENSHEWKATYRSLFFPDDLFVVNGDCFKLQLDNGSLYLMKVTSSLSPSASNNQDEFELYAVNYGGAGTVCRSWTNGNHVFAGALKTLYVAAAESSKHVKLSDGVRNLITHYMSNRLDLEDLPF